MLDLSMEEARKGMVEKKMSPEQVDQALGMMQKFFVPFAIGGALFLYLFVGVIAALIGVVLRQWLVNYLHCVASIGNWVVVLYLYIDL